MPPSFLNELLRPYQQTMAGQEIDVQTDPLYSAFMAEDQGLDSLSPQSVGGLPSGAPASALQAMVKQLAMNKYGWGGPQWRALKELVSRESGWSPTADNPTSSAYGLFQFLDSTFQNYGGFTKDPRQQALMGLRYISDRYSDPLSALRFHTSNNYY